MDSDRLCNVGHGGGDQEGHEHAQMVSAMIKSAAFAGVARSAGSHPKTVFPLTAFALGIQFLRESGLGSVCVRNLE